MKTLDKVLVIVAIFLVLFITTMCVFFWKFQAIPEVLVTCVLGTGSAELVVSALITIFKKKYEVKDGEDRTDC